jgi:signal transduction histidine kinase
MTQAPLPSASSLWRHPPLKEQWAAIITWLAFSYIQLHGIWHNSAGAWLPTLLLALSLLLFMHLFLRLHQVKADGRSFAAIGVMWLCLWLNAFWVPNGFTPGLAVLWVIILTPLLPSSRIYWMIIPASLPYAVVNLIQGFDYNSVMMLLVCATFQYFAIFAMHKAQSEQRARQHLAELHEKLLIAQQQLQQQAADAERLRIARDLHDSLGHHLTALVIQLQLAEHQAKTMPTSTLTSPLQASSQANATPADKPSAAEIQQQTAQHERHRQQLALCHQLAKTLLQDIRQTVTQWRQPTADPLIATLNQNLSTPARSATTDFLQQCEHFRLNMAPLQLHVRLASHLRLDPLNSALLTRVTQEACTNSVRHGHANQAWLCIYPDRSDPAILCYHYWDNGHLAQWPLPAGNGLEGMRERIEDAGGELDFAQKHRSQRAQGRGNIAVKNNTPCPHASLLIHVRLANSSHITP